MRTGSTSIDVLLFSSLIFEVNMSDEMSDEKGWDFENFCPLYAPKISWTRKDTGDFTFPAYRGKKHRFPTLNATLKWGAIPEIEGFLKMVYFEG